ncbi:MAG: hypothetical protein KDA60_13260 [Planctomycetales bacterium]|nr:hypothetical protein [Planctomycetales bacterium]
MSSDDFDSRGFGMLAKLGVVGVVGGMFLLVVFGFLVYTQFRIDVPSEHIAVLIKKTGKDLDNGVELAPDSTYKGLQRDVLQEGRYFRNPYTWTWRVYPMVEIPEDKMGVRIRLHGEDLPYGHFVATKEEQKGIVEEVLRPGRYPINARVQGKEDERRYDDYVELIELHEPVTIPAGFKGIVTNLAGPIPDDPNVLLVEDNKRGVQKAAKDPGTYYLNPYMVRIDPIDCRSQRFNLSEGHDMGFPSKDGFWVSLDGIIEFRVNPEKASEVYVTYNEVTNDEGAANQIGDEIIKKVIMPNARAFCRLRGSNSSGRDFIGGKTRSAFQAAFQEAIQKTCDQQGIEIVQALITKIHPPQAIAQPVRDREVARQELKQYQQEKLQQDAEAKLAIEKELISQKQALVQAEQQVVQKVTKANESQQVAILKAEEELEVARRDLEAAKDKAEAMLSLAEAEAGIAEFENKAQAAGWKRAVEALGGDGDAYARYVLYQKLAPGFRSIMTNTADSPLMEVFQNLVPSRSTPTAPPVRTAQSTRPAEPNPPTEAPTDAPAPKDAESAAAE